MTTAIRYRAKLDFEDQIRGYMVRNLVRTAVRQDNTLPSFEEALDDVRVKQIVDRGVEIISVEQICGSYSNNRNFDADFRPRLKSSEERWIRIRQAHYEDVALPAISVYKIDEVYYVEDGHHRVSVARSVGQSYIDAYVHEVIVE
jgi:hypothetical protein